jgi:hypothetical protein
MSETAFERDAGNFKSDIASQGYLLFSGNYLKAKTTGERHKVELLKDVIDHVLEQTGGRDFVFAANEHNGAIDASIMACAQPFTGNKLRLYAKQGILGYSAELNLYIRDHPMPIQPRYEKRKDPDTQFVTEHLLLDKRIIDAFFYLGLQAPERNDAVPIPLATD